jgi:hypothetical protein
MMLIDTVLFGSLLLELFRGSHSFVHHSVRSRDSFILLPFLFEYSKC